MEELMKGQHLQKAFKIILDEMVKKAYDARYTRDLFETNPFAKRLVYEVKIRTLLK